MSRRDKKRIEPTAPVEPAEDDLTRRQRRKQAKSGRGPAPAGGAPDPSAVLASITGDVGGGPAPGSASASADEAAEIAALTTRHRSSALSPSAPEPIAPRMRAFRFPALLVVIALLVGAALVERGEVSSTSVDTAPTDLGRLMPVASAADARSSTSFCAGGTGRGSTDPIEGAPGSEGTTDDPTTDDPTTETTDTTAPDGSTTPGTTVTADATEPSVPVVAEHTVLIGNLGDADREVVVTAVPSEGDQVSRTVTVPARTRTSVPLAELVTAPFVSALVEADGGGIAVEHQVEGPTGRSVAPCASSASDAWYFPAGTTRLGTRHIYTVFNPFPQQAVVDFSFMVEEDGGRQATRRSDQLEGIVVPPSRVVAVDITDIITVRDQVATTVTTRSGAGRVVVDQLQVSDGRSDWPENLAVTLGAPAPAATWLFADNRPLADGVETRFVAFNPGDVDAELEVFVQVDGLSLTSTTEPFVVTVRAGQYATIPIGTDNRIPVGFGAFVVAVSRNQVPVVVERVMIQLEPADPDGAVFTMGSPLVAREWLVPVGGLEGQEAMQVSIANPSVSESVTLTVEAVGEGDAAALEDFDGVTLGPGARTVVDLAEAQGAAALMLRIRASGPVVAGQLFAFDDPGTLSDTAVLPVSGTLVLPGGEITDRGALPAEEPEPFDGTVPPGTAPTGTTPGTEVPGSSVPPATETTTTTVAPDPAAPVTDPATGAPVDPAAASTTVAPG